MRPVTALLAGAFLLGMTMTGAADYNYGIAGIALICVPESSVPEYNRDLTQSDIFLGPKSIPTDLITIQYDGVELRRDIPNYYLNRDYSADSAPNIMSLSVMFIRPQDPKGLFGEAAGPDAVRIWQKSGACKKPVIAHVPGSATYLAACSRGDIGHILYSQKPGADPKPTDVYDTVLAECWHTSIGFGPHKGQELESCIRRIRIGRFRIDYEFQIQNAGVIPQMDAFLRAKVDVWKRNCHRR